MFVRSLLTLTLLCTSTFASSTEEQFLRGGRNLAPSVQITYDIPLWYERIQEQDTTGSVQMCVKRDEAPTQGSVCSKREKTCFFGTQDCDGVGAHPEIKCDCVDRKWQCVKETCPGRLDTGCPAEGETMDHGNDSRCPDDSPISAGSQVCSMEQDTLTCKYGSESCCGQCYAENNCECDTMFGWACFVTDACLVAPCRNTDWTQLIGTTCLEARTMIFAEYPGMTVICQKPSDPITPSIEQDDYNRYMVYTTEEGIVTEVVFNRNIECPVEKTDFCLNDGQKCEWTTKTMSDTEICEDKETCTCTWGQYNCQVERSCVEANPPTTSSSGP